MTISETYRKWTSGYWIYFLVIKIYDNEASMQTISAHALHFHPCCDFNGRCLFNSAWLAIYPVHWGWAVTVNWLWQHVTGYRHGTIGRHIDISGVGMSFVRIPMTVHTVFNFEGINPPFVEHYYFFNGMQEMKCMPDIGHNLAHAIKGPGWHKAQWLFKPCFLYIRLIIISR